MIVEDQNEILFSIVVLNWNSFECLKKCLAALKKQTFRSFEVIVIDNGSTDESLEYIKKIDAEIIKIFNPTNLGFAEGMNQGFNQANGKWVMALNVDLFLADDYLEQAARIISENPDVDMLGSKIFRYDNGYSDEVICTSVWPTTTMSVKTYLQAPDGEYEVFGPGGCCPLFSKQALDKVSFAQEQTGQVERQAYDNQYFAYGEDVDLFIRLALFGYKCIYSSRLEAWHVHSATQSGIRWYHKDSQTLKRLAANAISTWVKNYPGHLLNGKFIFILAIPLIMSLTLIRKSPTKCIWPLIGYMTVIGRWKGLLKKRLFIQVNKTKSLLEYNNFFR